MTSIYGRISRSLICGKTGNGDFFQFADAVAAEDQTVTLKFISAGGTAAVTDDHIDMVIPVGFQRFDIFPVGYVNDPVGVIHFISPMPGTDPQDIHDGVDMEIPVDIRTAVAVKVDTFAEHHNIVFERSIFQPAQGGHATG